MQGLPFGPQNMPYYGAQPQFMQQPPAQPPMQPPMIQPTTPQAAQPPTGDIWSQITGFSKTPQGQEALLAFANAAMQNSMNPRTGGGMGLINSVGAGMQGYKQGVEQEREKAWREESRGMQREAHGWQKQEASDLPERQKHAAAGRQREEAEWALYPPGASQRLGDRVKGYERVKGVDYLVEKELTGFEASGMPKYKEVSRVPRKEPGSSKTTIDSLDIYMMSAGVDPSVGPRNKEEADRVMAVMKKNQGMTLQDMMMMLMTGKGGFGDGANPSPGPAPVTGAEGLTEDQLRAIAEGKKK